MRLPARLTAIALAAGLALAPTATAQAAAAAARAASRAGMASFSDATKVLNWGCRRM